MTTLIMNYSGIFVGYSVYEEQLDTKRRSVYHISYAIFLLASILSNILDAPLMPPDARE